MNTVSTLSVELINAYNTTCYLVNESPVGPFPIRIDVRSRGADNLCEQLEVTHWAFITPCNPRSKVLSPEKNAERLASLEEKLRASALAYFPGEGVGEDPKWVPEKSFLILGITQEDADKLGREFEQNAIVVGAKGKSAVLHLIDLD